MREDKQETRQTVQAFYQAWMCAELDKATGLLSPLVQWIIAGSHGGQSEGVPFALRDPSFYKYEVIWEVYEEGTAVVLYTCSSGGVDLHIADFIEVRGGRITSVNQVYDATTLKSLVRRAAKEVHIKLKNMRVQLREYATGAIEVLEVHDEKGRRLRIDGALLDMIERMHDAQSKIGAILDEIELSPFLEVDRPWTPGKTGSGSP